MKKERMDNIELLRIIAMLMVVSLHFLSRGGINSNANFPSGIYYLSSFWDAISIISVNIYIIISGYFLVESNFKISKLIYIIVQVFTYSFGFYLLGLGLGLVRFNVLDLVKSLLPLLTYQYWFASVYVGLYIIFPFLNKGIKAMDEKQHRILCIILFVMFDFYLPSKALGVNGYSIMWMMSLYIFAAYLRLYYKPTGRVTSKLMLLYCIPTILLPCTRFLIDFVGKLINRDLSGYSKFFYKNNSIFVCASSIALFVIFLNIKIKSIVIQKIIRLIAPLTFGVYLVHNNPTIRDALWSFIRPYRFMYETGFFLVGCAIVCVIFIISAVIEYCRRLIVDKISNFIFTKNIIVK